MSHWVFQSERGDLSWHGEATDEAAEYVRLKLETEVWLSPTRMRPFAEDDRMQVEAEVRGAPDGDGHGFDDRWRR